MMIHNTSDLQPPADGFRPLSVGLSDAGEIVGVSRRTIQTLVSNGEITTFEIGSRKLIAYAELERFIQSKISKGAENVPTKKDAGKRPKN